MIFIGFGQGFAMSPLTNLGISNVNSSDAGAASGLVNVAHQIGGAFGLSIMVAASNGLDNTLARFHIGMLVALTCIVLALCSIIIKTKCKFSYIIYLINKERNHINRND